MRTNNDLVKKASKPTGWGKKALLLGSLAMLASYATPDADADLINGVNYNNGVSEIVWSDDGSYGILVDNHVDNGKVRVLEYAKVSDSNFTRDSFTLNSDYTFAPLNNSLINAGIVGDVDEANALYSQGLNSGGALNPGTGWSLVNNGNGTDNIDHAVGREGRDYTAATLGDYAVRERSVSASEFTNGSVIDDILVNGNLDPYLQVTFQGDNQWNLRSNSDSGAGVYSTGINGAGIGVIPEPATMGLLGLGGGIIGLIRLYGQK